MRVSVCSHQRGEAFVPDCVTRIKQTVMVERGQQINLLLPCSTRNNTCGGSRTFDFFFGQTQRTVQKGEGKTTFLFYCCVL